MTDLTRRSPEIFNIRHTERGVQTRNTKRKGGNLHCIMAFKKVEAGPSGFFINVGQSLDEQENSQSTEEAELQVLVSEMEDLNSSDSDFPMEIETREYNHIIDVQEEATQTSLTDTGKKVLEAWSDARAQIGEKSSNDIRIPVEDLDLEGVDGGQVEQDRADDDTLDSTLTEENQVFATVAPAELSTPQDERDDPFLTSSTIPVIQATPPPQNATSPTEMRRYGTFRKKRSSLLPNKTRSSSSSSDEDSNRSPSVKRRSRSATNSKGKKINSENMANLEVESSTGAGVQRQGTFTKKVPTIRVERTRPLSTTSNSSDQEDVPNDSEVKEEVDFNGPTESGLKRSGTFTKSPPRSDQAPPTASSDQVPPTDGTSDMAELTIASPAESGSPSSNLRRSGTFTKEKPDIIVLKTRESSTSSASEKEMLSDAEMELATTSGLKRSGTFTKEKPNGAGEEQLDMLQMSANLLHYNLDDTLKDTLEVEASINDPSSSEESVEETLVLTDGSPSKWSYTSTKERPFLT